MRDFSAFSMIVFRCICFWSVYLPGHIQFLPVSNFQTCLIPLLSDPCFTLLWTPPHGLWSSATCRFCVPFAFDCGLVLTWASQQTSPPSNWLQPHFSVELWNSGRVPHSWSLDTGYQLGKVPFTSLSLLLYLSFIIVCHKLPLFQLLCGFAF